MIHLGDGGRSCNDPSIPHCASSCLPRIRARPCVKRHGATKTRQTYDHCNDSVVKHSVTCGNTHSRYSLLLGHRKSFWHRIKPVRRLPPDTVDTNVVLSNSPSNARRFKTPQWNTAARTPPPESASASLILATTPARITPNSDLDLQLSWCQAFRPSEFQQQYPKNLIIFWVDSSSSTIRIDEPRPVFASLACRQSFESIEFWRKY